jgi:iron complex transport system substrate-binding protein
VGKEKELTVIDSLDNIVTVNKPVNRIVAPFSQVLELLRTFKLEKDRMVGAESVFYSGETLANYKLFFPEWIDLPPVGAINNPDVEAILDLHPDVALLPASGWCAHMNDPAHNILKSVGISVLRVYGGVGTGAGAISIDETKKFGYIFDKEDKSEEFIDWYESFVNSIDEAVEKIPEEDKPKVYFESVMGGRKYSASSEIYAHVGSAGGKSIFPKGGVVDPEAVIVRNPDIIIIMSKCGGYNLDVDDIAELEKMREEMMNRPELLGVTAVKEGRVYVISNYITCFSGEYNGCNCLLQIVYMAKWFHPELFEDLDPRAIQQEYLTRFQGLDIDLDKQGVFVYPEEQI